MIRCRPHLDSILLGTRPNLFCAFYVAGKVFEIRTQCTALALFIITRLLWTGEWGAIRNATHAQWPCDLCRLSSNNSTCIHWNATWVSHGYHIGDHMVVTWASHDGSHMLNPGLLIWKVWEPTSWAVPGNQWFGLFLYRSNMHSVFNLYMWHDQGKWVTCRKFQFQFSYTTFS